MHSSVFRYAALLSVAAGLAACTAARNSSTPATTLPADVNEARPRLAASPRHGEWVMISAGADSVRAYVVYPERKTKAPVVVVVHEIYGLTPWVRGVADQLAADGFIAIAPDLLTSKNLPNPTDSVSSNSKSIHPKRSTVSPGTDRSIRRSWSFLMTLRTACMILKMRSR